MPLVLTEKLMELQKNPANIRNICILAHVDHGKTTLADSLISSNGLISKRLSGRMRYLDSRQDEQERGITMKSSAVTLYHRVRGEEDYHLINLIDTPGHVDFSSEVSTATRLCDGAIVVVDVVEGVQPQTKTVLQQAWNEGIKPVLVLNKMDRLVVEMKLSPADAYDHLNKILERINAVIGELFATRVLKEDNEYGLLCEDADDSDLYFTPDSGNVVFASAYDGWGFDLEAFANLYSAKLKVDRDVFLGKMWDRDYYLNAKTKTIEEGATLKGKRPVFVQLILDNIWTIYETVFRKDTDKLKKVIESLKLDVPDRDIKSNDCRQVISSVFSRWLPLTDAVLDMVCRKLPSPLNLSSDRCERLMFPNKSGFESLPSETRALKRNFLDCNDAEDNVVIAFVSKMIPVSKRHLPQNRPKPLTQEELLRRREAARAIHKKQAQTQQKDNVELTEEQLQSLKIKSEESKQKQQENENDNDTTFIAFARIYSGSIRPGQDVYVLGPKHDPEDALSKIRENKTVFDPESSLKTEPSPIMRAKVDRIYLLLGRELEELDQGRAGNIVGIGGLEDYILKSATLCSEVSCPPFVETTMMSSITSVPILRTAVEPVISTDLNRLVRGLKLLNQADANVQIVLTNKGEHLLLTAGEVHLERCLRDLKEIYAVGVDIRVSDPIIPFRETIVLPPETDMVNEATTTTTTNNDEDKIIEVETPDKRCIIKIKACPLPKEVVDLLDRHSNVIRKLEDSSGSNVSSSLQKEKEELKVLFKSLDVKNEDLTGFPERIWSFGPKKSGDNILLNGLPDYEYSIWSDKKLETRMFHSNIVNGFQMACAAGPLCEEPLRGVAFTILEWRVLPETDASSSSYGPLSGQIMSAMKEGCRRSFQVQPQRLMAAMFSCEIEVKAEVLGKMYAVLGKRHGKIVRETMIEGSSTFRVIAHLPAIECRDFINVIRKQTSGLAMPQLIFSHWETIDLDPFWVPVTEEEILHFGDKADSENIARLHMNHVRKRKGLSIDEKIVEFAEKQRTISKKK